MRDVGDAVERRRSLRAATGGRAAGLTPWLPRAAG
jgi:hypothetical protein